MEERADAIIRSHMKWAMAAGAVPLPVADVLAITGIQLDMLKQLAALYGVDYTEERGKAWLSAFTATTMARIGANFIKFIPGFGSIIGGATMAIIGGASTYGLGQVAVKHFSEKGTFTSMDLDRAKSVFDRAYAEGKRVVEGLKKREDALAVDEEDPIAALERLAGLVEKGILTQEEFEAKKAELLARI